MKFKLLKLLVRFLKWLSKQFEQEIRIYIGDKPKRVTLHNAVNIRFLGDYVTFYECKYITNCYIFTTKESYAYAYENYKALFEQCDNISYCSHLFLKVPKNSYFETMNNGTLTAGFNFDMSKENEYSGRNNNTTMWTHLKNIDNPREM